jgi:diguanylate cyclase (GGDEF)-like protein
MADGKPRILLADDSKVVRVSAQRILSEEFDVVLAENGEQAFEMLAKDRAVEAVFTDLGMPKLDGYGLIERLRGAREQRLKVIPIIVVTANESDDARQKALALGATDLITKPFNKVDLTARAKAHVEQARKVRDLSAKTKELEQIVTIDPLTRLGNKQHFDDKLNQARAFTLRHKQALSLVRLDLDQAKALAQKHGKDVLEGILKELGALVRTTIRTEDSAARVGATSFAMVLPTCDADGAKALAQRLMRVIEAAAQRHQKRGISYHVSIGIMTASDHPDLPVATLVEHVEEAVKHAAGLGGGKIHIWAPHKPAAAAAPTLVAVGEAPTLEKALEMIAAGQSSALAPFMPALLKRLIPLLRLASKQHQAALADYLSRSAKKP